MEQNKNKKQPTTNRGSTPLPPGLQDKSEKQDDEKEKGGEAQKVQQKNIAKTNDQDISNEWDII
jgi:hypothetical protein